jgi:hypothetical protein
MDDVKQSLHVRELIAGSIERPGKVYHYPAAYGRPGATATVGYVNTGRDTGMVTLAQNATADTWVIPLHLREGDIITSIGIHGQGDSGGNAYTVDYALRAQTAATAGCTDAVVQAGTQIAKTADYLINDVTAVATPHTVLEGNGYYMLITCTTAAVTDIELLNIELTITEK